MFAAVTRFITFCLVLLFASVSLAQDSEWTSLFDGKTMTGWEKVGNPKSVWAVKEGSLSGSGPPSMLVNTTGPYKNFRYRAEIKISDGGNSGMYFRTTRKPGFTDGYEAQIDSTHRDPIRTGSIYGMCHVYKQHVKPDTWFTYEIEVRDDVWRRRELTRIKVSINGEELYEYMDFEKTFKEGHFAFQHHDPGSIVHIRKVEVMDLDKVVTAAPKEVGFVDLFNGKDLKGWTQRNGTATYRVEGDSIVGKTTEGSPNSFLCTNKRYGNFELKFDVKVDSRLNSGVQIRSQTADGKPQGRVNGPQVEISTDKMAGYVYGEAAGGWMTRDADRKPHETFQEDKWNSYHVVAYGNRIETWINGKQISDLTHEERFKSHPNGFIGLQVHGIGRGAGPYEVRWRNIKLRDLSDFKPLYNGKDLSGWETTGNWIVQDDGSLLIEPRDGEKGWSRWGAYLWSKKKYKDFVLDVEYAYPPGGNSGVYFRVADKNNPVNKGIEAQILDSSKKKEPLTSHDHGGIVGTQSAATSNMSQPPNVWNRMVVTCIGKSLEVDLNGETIVKCNLDKTPMQDRPLTGFIGFQDHGQPNNIKFRNIRIREINQ